MIVMQSTFVLKVTALVILSREELYHKVILNLIRITFLRVRLGAYIGTLKYINIRLIYKFWVNVGKDVEWLMSSAKTILYCYPSFYAVAFV